MKSVNKANTAIKVIASVITLTVLLGLLASCAADIGGAEDADLNDIVEALYKGVEVPAYDIVPLDEENFEYYAFVPYDDSLRAVEADGLVSISAHSLVVIQTDKGNGKELAEDIILNADPNKWLCVGAETVNVAYTDNFVVLVMSDSQTADAIVKNFEDWVKGAGEASANVLSSDNSRFEDFGV